MNAMNSEKRRDQIGALLGAITGGLFALSAWGLDAFITVDAHSVAGWAKVIPGMIAAVGSAALAGYITARTSRLPAIIATWVLWGALMSVIASLLPFDYQAAIIRLTSPLLKQEIDYPLPDYHGRRIFLSLIITFGLTFIISILFSNLVDLITANLHLGTSILAVAAISIIFLLFGYSLDSIYNRPFRNAVHVTHETIQTARANPDAMDSGRQSNTLDLLGIRSARAVLDRPYTIVVKSYNLTLESVQVLIDFDGFWYECSVNDNLVYFCR